MHWESPRSASQGFQLCCDKNLGPVFCVASQRGGVLQADVISGDYLLDSIYPAAR